VNIATLSQPLPPVGFKEFRILPAGLFRTSDGSGRPDGIPGWIMNATIAQQIIATLAARDDTLIDYEHRSMQASADGGTAPAAGWFKRAEWREGDGLYATDARWTAKASAMIAAKEYRFISPVFSFNKHTGEVDSLISVGLVNRPALSGLTDLAVASAAMPRQRDTDRAIEAFNTAFGMVGIFHPETPPEMLAALRAQFSPELEAKPTMPAGMNAHDAAKLRHAFPGVWD
jgi:phage I-like protein